MSWIGLDIGGANIKIVGADGEAISAEFPLWKNRDGLTSKLEELLPDLTTRSRLAVTMTGELADCFDSKKVGVRHIVDAAVAVGGTIEPVFYQTTGKFVRADEAIEDWQKTAASNWHALATFVSRFMPEKSGIVVDIGSTTTDIIPVRNGTPCSPAKTDTTRLQSCELVYTGIVRSPINGLLDCVTIDGIPTRIANEVFATTLDAHMYLKNIPERSFDQSTADGRPANLQGAATRLARVVCADLEELKASDIHTIAVTTVKAQTDLIAKSIGTVRQNFSELKDCLLVSGSGAWLAKQIIQQHFNMGGSELLEFGTEVTAPTNCCAPAYAVSQLAQEAPQ